MLDLVKNNLELRTETYLEMVKEIEANLPVIQDGCRQFGKSQSQFMDNFLTVSHPTPLRNARQILAEVNKSLEALKEAQYQISKKKIKIERWQRELDHYQTGDLRAKELELKIAHAKAAHDQSMLYVEGAIRQITNYIEQYHLILKNHGYEKMTEEAFEAEEEKYHIMKSFDQAICAARSRSGMIDEGNHIYFSQIGVNGQMAQNYILKFFQQEQKAIMEGKRIDHNFLCDFLEEMAKLFEGCSKVVAERKRNTSLTKKAILRSV